MDSPIRPHVKVGPTATHLPELPVATHSNFRPIFALSSTPTIFLYHDIRLAENKTTEKVELWN